MRRIAFIVFIFALGLTAGVLVMNLSKSLQPATTPADSSEQYVVTELPSSHKSDERENSDEASDVIVVEDGSVVDGENEGSVEVGEPVRLAIDGCPDDLQEYMLTLYKICTSYTTDGTYVYFHGEPIEADPDTFEVFAVELQDFVSPNNPDYLFGQDKHAVFFQNNALRGVAPGELYLLGSDSSDFDEVKASETLNTLVVMNPEVEALSTLFTVSKKLYQYDEYARQQIGQQDYVVATVDGSPVMHSDIGNIFFPAQVPRSLLLNQAEHGEIWQQSLDAIIEQKLWVAAATKAEALPSQSEMDRELAVMTSNMGSAFSDRWQRYGMTEQQVVALLEARIIIEKFKEEVVYPDAVASGEYQIDTETGELAFEQKLQIADEYIQNLKKAADIVVFE